VGCQRHPTTQAHTHTPITKRKRFFFEKKAARLGKQKTSANPRRRARNQLCQKTTFQN
jgi:hypothetical protein